jgi:hypothetical protein
MTITGVVREGLADYAHRAWAGWMKYMFEKSIKNEDGTVTIPASLVERWSRQMNTPYPMLPENEQQSDLIEADKMLEIASAWEELYPRAFKLMDNRKTFVVVASDEPYFKMVYDQIKLEELLKGTWTDEDERAYQACVSSI